MRRLIVILVVLFSAAHASAQAWTGRVRGSWVNDPHDPAGVVLASPLGVCAIVVAPTEQPCVKQAAVFLAGDIERLTGKRPPILDKPDEHGGIIRLATAADDARWEAFSIKTIDASEVRLSGSNPRGTAFAAYTLAERLGIDPLYHWTRYTPERHETLVTKAIDFCSGPPTFKYRGMFHDDEDILPRPYEPSGYPDRIGSVPTVWYERFFETALRLRMNMVAPYTRVTRRYEVQKLASDWGLFYTSHHYDVLLSNPFGIKRFGLGAKRNAGETWDWLTNRDGMLRYWRGGLEENAGLDCIWPVGLRGVDDTGYKFPKDMPESEQSRVFTEAVAEQVRMTKELVPPAKQPPVFHWTLYTEMLPKYQAGLLDVPEDVIVVWPDDNDGVMRGLPTKPDKWKHGVYYHLAYLGKQVKQNFHIVPPWRVAEQFDAIVKAGATEYMLVNVSELREFVMEARQIAEICWDAKTALAGVDPAGRYVNWWCREYFGDGAADAEEAYAGYYKVFDSYEQQWAGAEAVHEALGRLMRDPKSRDADAAARLATHAAELDRILMRVAHARQRMTRPQQLYFYDHVEFPLRVEYLATMAAATLNETGDTRAAMGYLGQLELAIIDAQQPPFGEWYRETWVRRGPKPYNLHRPYRELRRFIDSGGKEFELPDLGRFSTTTTTATSATSTAPSR